MRNPNKFSRPNNQANKISKQNSQANGFPHIVSQLSLDLALRTQFELSSDEKIDETLSNFATSHNWISNIDINDYGCYCRFDEDIDWTGTPKDELDKICKNFKDENDCLKYSFGETCDVVLMSNYKNFKIKNPSRSRNGLILDQSKIDKSFLVENSNSKLINDEILPFNTFPCDKNCLNFNDKEILETCYQVNQNQDCQANSCSVYMDFVIKLSILARNTESYVQNEEFFDRLSRKFEPEKQCRVDGDAMKSLRIASIELEDSSKARHRNRKNKRPNKKNIDLAISE